MIQVVKSDQRGHSNFEWLDSLHTFSFADYHNPGMMGFRSLRVINEDIVAPSMGFGMHPHRDMEIVTYVIKGAVEHKDSMGSSGVIRPGEVQRMSAGTGMRHSEYNPSDTEPLHLLQIWILPNKRGFPPSYEQKKTLLQEEPGKLHLLAGPEGGTHTVTIQQDVKLYGAKLPAGKGVEHLLASGRYAWIQVVSGELVVNGQALSPGDAAAVGEEERLEIAASLAAEFLLFDLS